MDDIDQTSDQLLCEIMQLEHEINKIMALSKNRENHQVRQYRQFILAKKNKLQKLNNNYDGVIDAYLT